MAREPSTVGGLKLPKDLGVSETEARAVENRWNTVEAVDERLRLQGIHNIVVPDITCPEVTTAALVTTDINEYTTIFSAQLRWYNYAVRLLAETRAVLLQLVNEMADIESSKRIAFRKQNEGKLKTDKLSATEMEDLTFQDPRYRDLKVERQQVEQHKLKLEAWVETLDRNLKTVSRQIENRKAEGLGGNRENNMAGAASGRWENRNNSAPVERGFTPRRV